MNLNNILNNVLTPKNNTSIKDKDPTFELKKLQQQMRLHAQQERKPCTQFFNFSERIHFDKDNMNALAEKEISHMSSKKGWKSLPKSMQWELINDYFAESEKKEDVLKTMKKMLQNNQCIDLTYDNKARKIMNINIPCQI